MPTHELTFRFLAAPTDIGLQGKVPGGRVLEWIDKAAYGISVAYAKTSAVTAYVGNVVFNHAIANGELVETHAQIVRTGRTSMTILVTVRAGSPKSGEMNEACRCALVFVAIDENGKGVEVPQFVPETELEKKFYADAEELDKSRKDIERLMSRASYTDAGQGERITMRFLAKPTDVNWGGNVHGGTAMEWIDEAATACTMNWAGRTTIGVYAGGVRFYKPIHIGDLVEVRARILRTGRTSMNVSVHVHSGEPRKGLGGLSLALHSSMTYVAIDEEFNPQPVPHFTPVTDEDKRLHAHDLQLKALREKYQPLPLVEPADADFTE